MGTQESSDSVAGGATQAPPPDARSFTFGSISCFRRQQRRNRRMIVNQILDIKYQNLRLENRSSKMDLKQNCETQRLQTYFFL